MDDNKLPIRFFDKRKEEDGRLVEGGGGGNPKWVLEGSQLKSKAQLLSQDLIQTEELITKKLNKYKNIPAIVAADISQDAIAKSHRKDINRFLLNDEKENRVIGLSEDRKLLLRIDKTEQLSAIKTKLDDYQRSDKAISGIDSIKPFAPKIDLKDAKIKKSKYVLKAKLANLNDFQKNDQVLKYFKSFVNRNSQIKIEKSVRYSDDLIIHEIVADSLDAVKSITDFNCLLSIEAMPMFDIEEDDFFDEGSTELPQPVNRDYPIVGVLDNGIAPIPELISWTFGRCTNYPTDLINFSHGTFVAGIINFGDIFEQRDMTGAHGFKLFDAAVFPDQDREKISEDELVDNIREAVEDNADKVKIWNMSLGSKVESDPDKFSDFGIALDNIQDENDVLIIKSAGNCKNFLDGQPASRIAIGADSVRALTIGSIAQAKTLNDIADINDRSPFSRIGPGPADIIKPELVHYGGNAGIDNGNVVGNGVRSITASGDIKRKVGTSFSTPRVTSIVADLNERIDEPFDSILLKALTLHSASYSNTVKLPAYEKLNQLGFGLPKKAEDILFNDSHEITLIMRDSLIKGEYVEILDFPYPQSLIDEQGFFYGQIIVTVVNTPILNPGQDAEYCQSDLKVSLGTYDNKNSRDMKKRNIRNPIGRLGSQNLLNTNVYSRKKSLDKKVFSQTEKLLIKYGDKFYPNKKYAVDLSELKEGPKQQFIKAPKKWYLKIEGLYRDFIEHDAELKKYELSQEYCIVISIRDPLKNKNVYDDVVDQLNTNNFVHRSININTQVGIQSE